VDSAESRPETELWREFEIAQPRILGALLDAAVHGLRRWVAFSSTGCRAWQISRFGPQLVKKHSGLRALSRRPTPTAGPESIVEADPVATCVR
jgi:hypothetical protein